MHNSAVFNFAVFAPFISFYSGLCCEHIAIHFIWEHMTLTAWARFKMYADMCKVLVGISEEQTRTWASLNDVVVMGRSVMPVNILYAGRAATDH
jgi:hypothetical protein